MCAWLRSRKGDHPPALPEYVPTSEASTIHIGGGIVSFRRKLCWLSLGAASIAVAMLVAACGGDNDNEKPSTTPGTAKATAGRTPTGDTTGVTDTEIRIATLLPMSQSAAATWGVSLSKGMQAYYNYINDNGGIYGRKIDLIVGDNQFSGPVASEVVRKLVEQEKVFAIQGSLGMTAHSAIYKYLEENGVPDMFILAGDKKWTEPVARNRFTFLVDFVIEGRILGQYIAEKFDGKKLGILAENDDFGREGEEGLKLGIKDKNANIETVTEYYDEIQNDVSSQVQRLKNANVDVIGVYAMPMQAASLLKTARETLNWDVPIVITGTDAVEILGALAGYSNIEGAVSVVFGHQAFDTDQPGIARHIEMMAKYAPDVKPDNLTLVGQAVSEAMVSVLKQAGPDLTRESFLDAAESVCEYTCDTCIVPASLSPTDHRYMQMEVYVRATGTDADTFRWEPFGEPFGFESTKECVTPTPPPGYDQQPE